MSKDMKCGVCIASEYDGAQEPAIPVDCLVKCAWSKEFPQEAGLYWFHGYRYGKITCGQKSEPETMLVTVRKITNGFMYVADGQFMSEGEVEEPNFLPVVLPVLPDI